MKFSKIFNPETFPKNDQRSNVRPSVSFSKSGTISINKKAMELLDLKVDDGIIIVNSEENPTDFYTSKNKGGFVLREDAGKTALLFNHKQLVVEVMVAIGLDSWKTNRMFLSLTPEIVNKEKYYCLLFKK